MSSWLPWSRTSNANDVDPKTDSEKPVRALPASWYRSDALYELERRAIFSKKWLLVSHQARFRNVGDFLRIVEAGFDFILLKDRQGVIRAHHNICRHRAFPLMQKESGSAKILACKYHGLSPLQSLYKHALTFVNKDGHMA